MNVTGFRGQFVEEFSGRALLCNRRRHGHHDGNICNGGHSCIYVTLAVTGQSSAVEAEGRPWDVGCTQ